MAANDKNELLIQIATLINDNNNGEISPADIRTVLSAMVTADINMNELTDQFLSSIIRDAQSVIFNRLMDAPPHEEGALFYDKDKHALSYFNDAPNVTVNMGQELLIPVYNNSGVVIPNGAAVLPTGAVAGIATVAMSKADNIETATVSGLATHTIPNNTKGYIAYIGQVGDVDTSAWSAGDFLYLSDTVAGMLTNVEPAISSPVAIALVIGVSGSVIVGQREVKDPNAFGQIRGNSNSPNPTQLVTTTPQPISLYDDNLKLQKDITITTALAPGSGFTGSMAPTSLVYEGFYSTAFTLSFESSANTIVSVEAYKNGSPTGIRAIADLTNNNIDIATLTIPRIVPGSLEVGDVANFYIFCSVGTTTITRDNISFNLERVGL